MESSYVLADIHDLTPIFTPIRTTQRIRYTCFNVSPNYLVLGASSGALYVFRREPCSFLQLLPNQEGAIVHVAISPDEKLFAFASVRGIICVLEKNSSGLGSRRIFTSNEHIGAGVTSLQWNGQSNELFIGDQMGRVSIISLLPFMMKNMFSPPAFTLMVLDSQIVQMDWEADLLLVSTLTRSYICDVAKERFRQIGVKLRDGEYGSCFYVCGDLPTKTARRTEAVSGSFTLVGESEMIGDSEDLQYFKVFCARPGSRLWEVKVDGSVMNTHQFKHALAIPPTKIIKVPQSTCSTQEHDNEPSESTIKQESDVIWNNQSFNFCKLFILTKKYVFTYKRDGIYVFDPDQASVVMWSNDVVDIIDAKVLKDTIYLRTSSGQMFGILFIPLEKFLIRLYLRKQYRLCAKLCEMHSQYLMKELPSSSKLYLLADLGTKLSNDEVTERILPLLQEISKCAQETRSAQRLESGIFVVENLHFLTKEESETSIPDLPQVRKTERLKDKSRSLSVSPDRSRRKKKGDVLIGNSGTRRSDSSSSLPELIKNPDKSSPTGGVGVVVVDSSVSNNKNPLELKKKIENIDNCTIGMKKSFSKELFTSFDTSPETIQALKEIGQSVSSKITSSTKSLKEKWQVIEGKILRSEITPEPLDVRTADYIEKPNANVSSGKNEEDIVFSDHSKKENGNGKSGTHPNVDISNVITVLKQLDGLKNCEEEIKTITWKLFYEILLIYNNYISLLNNARLNNISVNFEESKNDDPLIQMKYFLVDWCDKSFPFELYFSAEVVKDLSERFHFLLQANVLIDKLKELISVMVCGECLESLLVIYPQESVHLDIALSRFLVVCSDLLDPHCVLQCIKESAITCYYASFCTVLDKYQAGVLQQVGKEKSVENSCWQWPLPLRLNAMFFMLQMNQIETCCMMGNNIDLQDIWYLVVRLQQQQGTEHNFDCNHSHSMFLMYLDRVSDRDLVMQNLLKNELLTSVTTLAFENVNQSFGGSCKCGFPFPVGKTSRVLFNEIGRIISNHLWLTNHDRHQQLCEKVPILWKQMLRNTPPDNLKSVLPLLVQLGDFSVLEPLLPFMTSEFWHQVLDMTATVQSGQCLKCGLQSIPRRVAENLSLSDVGALLVKHMGASNALDLLSKHLASTSHGVLDERFYKSCIFSAIVDSHCEDLRADAVNLALTSCESLLRKPLVSNELGKQLDEALALDLAKVSVPAGEPDCPNHHWGAKVNLIADPCPCCALPLGSPGLLQDTALLVFQCGHAFHAVCLCQRSAQACVCLLCNQGS